MDAVGQREKQQAGLTVVCENFQGVVKDVITCSYKQSVGGVFLLCLSVGLKHSV